MKKIGNTLYVTTPNSYIALDGEALSIIRDEEPTRHIPLLNLDGVITFGYTGASPAALRACAERGIEFSFFTESGRFLARVSGNPCGNVLLRKAQYRFSDSEAESLKIARNFLTGKLFNSRWVIERAIRDYKLRLDTEKLSSASHYIAERISDVGTAVSLDELRGFEGEAASMYFSVFDDLILQQKDSFSFKGRNKRPPLDNVNAMLSFAYTLLAHDCASALNSVGLDPYVGFLHRDRPGRTSLALDLMEEFRSVLADRFVLSLINNRQLSSNCFSKKENGAVLMTDDARKKFLASWQQKKKETITHPFIDEKIEWGTAPYVQALLLARYIRGDLDEYPPFMWK